MIEDGLMKTLLSCLLLLMMMSSAATAQEPLKVGDFLPKLPSLVPSGPSGTVLLVFRSADW